MTLFLHHSHHPVYVQLKCQEKISGDERLEIHQSYYSLESQSDKRFFIINTTKRTLTARPINKDLDDVDKEQEASDEENLIVSKPKSRRKYSFRYFFIVNGESIQVCKPFYLGTLSISQKPVYTAHNTKNVLTNTPAQDQRGKNNNSRRVPDGNPVLARQHIESFPTVESHYCRANTKRKYLGSHLSISKMYELYQEKCATESLPPVRKSLYYKIFNTEYNMGFHIPKSDRCDVCEKYLMAKKTETVTDDLQTEYGCHLLCKETMREVRKEKGSSGFTI